MFFKLYWLGAALALMPFLIQPEEVHREKLFPYVPEDTNGTTFLIDLEATTLSNIVLVKCPYTQYNHKTSNDSFIPTDDIIESESTLRDHNKLFAWVPLLRQSANQTKINCGIVDIETAGGSYIKKQWIFNVNWNDTVPDEIPTEKLHMSAALPSPSTSCDDEPANNLIISKEKGKSMPEKISGTHIKKPYVNQMIYYFKKPSGGDNDTIKKPCYIYKVYGKCPIFNLPSRVENNITNEVKKIMIDNLNGRKEEIKVNLKVDTNEDFYSGEKISLSKLRYLESGIKPIEDSTTSITSSFDINGFDLVQLTYTCVIGSAITNVTQKYYFGPKLNDSTFDKTEEISANDTSIKVKCDTTYLNVGYLKEIEYNGIHAGVKDL
uniref:Fam-a protein n=1 Tax=Strongyloides papillosus TaxID=174720 RepID=A0A0N5C7R4_STREA